LIERLLVNYLSRIVATCAGVVAAAALLLSIPLGIAVLALLSVLALAFSCAVYLFGRFRPVAPLQGDRRRPGEVIEGEYRVVDEAFTSRQKEDMQ
jgi:hypothetical protein